MAPLSNVLCFAAIVCFGVFRAGGSGAAEESPRDRWRDLIAEASRRYDIPEAWIRAVMTEESGGRTLSAGRPITSPAGAMGLMQLLPNTWSMLRARYGLGADPYAPRDNIFAGTAYLRELYRQFGYPNLFAAYNVGPGRFAAFAGGQRTLPPETQAYLADTIRYSGAAAPVPPVQNGRLFFARGDLSALRPPAAPGGLFFVLQQTGSRRL